MEMSERRWHNQIRPRSWPLIAFERLARVYRKRGIILVAQDNVIQARRNKDLVRSVTCSGTISTSLNLRPGARTL